MGDGHLYLMYNKCMRGGRTFYSIHKYIWGDGHLIFNVITNILEVGTDSDNRYNHIYTIYLNIYMKHM